MSSLFTTFLYQPLLNALVLLYQYLPGHDFGTAIIALTVLLRLALYPLSAQATRMQQKMARLQPKVKEIQERFKGRKDEQGRALYELYQKERVNPFAGILPLLIQIPVLIALYRLFWNGVAPDQLKGLLYSFVNVPDVINTSFFGILDLKGQSYSIAVLAGLFQFVQTKQTMNAQKKPADLALSERSELKGPQKDKPDFSSMMQKQMLYLFPILTVSIVAKAPSAVGLYWIATSIFSIWQQWHITKQMTSPALPRQSSGLGRAGKIQ
ncbi:MAG: membrane protein insertase YidC [Candidatus Wildermuthbacteria bacterium]|nr:membrane protein insertase YidC [Candidatus Wildermuthbacteria bacterium]